MNAPINTGRPAPMIVSTQREALSAGVQKVISKNRMTIAEVIYICKTEPDRVSIKTSGTKPAGRGITESNQISPKYKIKEKDSIQECKILYIIINIIREITITV